MTSRCVIVPRRRVLRVCARACVRGVLLEQVVGHVVVQPAGRAGCPRSAGGRRGAGRRGPSAGRPRRTARRGARSVPGSRVVATRRDGRGVTTREGVQSVASDERQPRAGAGQVLRSRGDGVREVLARERPLARRPAPRSTGTPRRGQVADRLGDDADRVALLLDEVAVDGRAVPGHDDRVGAEQAEHEVEARAASPAGSSRRRTTGGPHSSTRSPASSTSASATRTTSVAGGVAAAGVDQLDQPVAEVERPATEENVWSAGTISVARTSSRCGSSGSSAYRSLIRSPAVDRARGGRPRGRGSARSPYASRNAPLPKVWSKCSWVLTTADHRRRRRGARTSSTTARAARPEAWVSTTSRPSRRHRRGVTLTSNHS